MFFSLGLARNLISGHDARFEALRIKHDSTTNGNSIGDKRSEKFDLPHVGDYREVVAACRDSALFPLEVSALLRRLCSP
jgi:hypothetical protein